MVSRQKKSCVSNLEFEQMFPKEFIYFKDKSPLEIIKFFLFFFISFDTKNIVERFKQRGGADNKEEDIDENEEEVAEDTFLAFLKEMYGYARSVVMWFVSKFSAFFLTLIMWSTYPTIPFFAAMAGMAGVLKYIFWKFRKL